MSEHADPPNCSVKDFLHGEHRPHRLVRVKAGWGIAGFGLAGLVLAALAIRGLAPEPMARIARVNRRWINPLILALIAGQRFGVARLEHRGRSSGALHATPILPAPVREGFVVALPYGRDVDWAQNLLRSGEGVLQHQGVRYRVGEPHIVPAVEALVELPAPIRALAGVFGPRDVLRVTILPNLTAETPPPA
jgi:hypothetical protein